MTVIELIERLKNYPESANVFISKGLEVNHIDADYKVKHMYDESVTRIKYPSYVSVGSDRVKEVLVLE